MMCKSKDGMEGDKKTKVEEKKGSEYKKRMCNKKLKPALQASNHLIIAMRRMARHRLHVRLASGHHIDIQLRHTHSRRGVALQPIDLDGLIATNIIKVLIGVHRLVLIAMLLLHHHGHFRLKIRRL